MIKINPAKVLLVSDGMDDQIISGIQIQVDPNGNLAIIKPGRVKINSLFMDLNVEIETDFSTAPTGPSLMALTPTLNLIYIDDNVLGDNLVLGVINKNSTLTLVTPVVYTNATSGVLPHAIINDVFSPDVSTETQIRMLFEELAINKTKDAELKYEEILEALPVEYNESFRESFATSTNFVSNTLVYNAYNRTISLGIVPPFPSDERKLVEKAVLLNTISKAYVAIDKMDNGQTLDIRISFNDGVTWMPYTEEGEYMAGVGQNFLIEFKMQSNNRNVSPILRSWAIFYQRV